MPPKKKKNREGKRERLARQYGFVLSFFESSPQLERVFNQAVKNTWTPDRFIAELRDTKWFKNHAASVRNAILQQEADPATYKQRVNQMLATVKDTWGSTFGATLDPKEAKLWAETAYRMGWSEAQLIDRMTKGVNYKKMLRERQLGGTAEQTRQQLAQAARAYGVKPSRNWMANQLSKIIEGRDTIEGTIARIQNWSQREYESFARELEGGATMADIAEPYVARMADLLEISPDTLDVLSPKIQKALRGTRNAEGKTQAMSLTDFDEYVRSDKRWQYTDNAREQAMGVTEGLLRDFGLLA